MTDDLRKTNALLSVIALVAIGFLLLFLRGVLVPLALAFFLSYLGMPLVRVGRRLRVPVGMSAFLVIAAFGCVLFGLGVAFYTSGRDFAEESPHYVARIEHAFGRFAERSGLQRVFDALESAGGTTEAPAAGAEPQGLRGAADGELFRVLQPGTILGVVSDLVGGVTDILLVLFFLFFILLDRGREAFDRRLIAAFSKEGTDSARPAVDEIHREIEVYILTKTGTSLLTGVAVIVALSVLDLPLALLFGLLAFLLNFIPNLGAVIATIPPVLIAFVHFEGGARAWLVLLSLGVVQGGIGVLEPFIMGRRLHLNPMTILLWLVAMGSIWGLWGVILAVPIAVAVRTILERTRSFRPLSALMREG